MTGRSSEPRRAPPRGGWLALRVRDSRAIVRSRPSAGLDADDSATILLVDDEESVQKLLAYPLERDGYRVVQARDGEEALRRFARSTSTSSCST